MRWRSSLRATRAAPSRRSSPSPVSRRSFSTSVCASIRRHARSGGPSASTRRHDMRPPAGSLRATTRRRRRSAPRSLPGRERAWRSSSAWPSSAGAIRSSSSTLASPISGRVAERRRPRLFRRLPRLEPDSPSAQRADTALHPNFPPGQPFFVPSFSPPASLHALSSPNQLAALARDARRPDARAKLLYGLALQRLGHRLSAKREYDAAAKLAPNDPEPLVAAAVSRFDKSRPTAAFSRLGPLTRRFPKAATVRFHLGLLLLWLAQSQPGSVDEGKRQLRLAKAQEPRSPLAREAEKLLARLDNVETG